MSSAPRNPRAVRASITDLLKQQARQQGRNHHTLLRRFVMSRFLTRIFDADPHGWILKGGVGMMVRLPEARHSRDIDLLAANTIADPVDELRRSARDHHLDALRFELDRTQHISAGKGTTVTVTAFLGATALDKFSIDIVAWRRPLVGDIEHQPLPQVIDSDDFPATGTAQLYPLADQIADKLCALYETHGPTRQPSGRFRDLVDLLLISTYLPVELETTVAAVERERHIRGLPALPDMLTAPGPQWTTQWAATAKKSPLPPEYHELKTAINAAGRCYNLILQSLPAASTPATWHHDHSQWHHR